MQRKIKIALKIITTLLVCVVVFFALSISAVRLFGLQVYGVLTGSMEPVYPTGSLIYVKEINTDKLEVGDVISFRISQNVIATHRIVELVPDESDPNLIRYRTKGDANDTVDSSLVNKYDIIGKVIFCIPKMGYFMDFVQSPAGIATTVGVSVALVLLVFISEVYTASNRTKMRWKSAIAKRLLGENAVPPQMANQHRRSNGSAPQRRPVQSRPQRYEDDYRPRRSYEEPPRRRYQDDYPARPQRSRYEDDYRPRRSYEEPPRRRYEDDYRPRRSYDEPPRRRYQDDYPARPQRSRYEDDYRPRRSGRFDDPED